MKKACINILSSRNKCLPLCVKSLWDMWNYKYNYPVYVHYFDDIYDNIGLREEIKNYTNTDIRFISIPYATPSHIKEEELYYNRTYLAYIKKGMFGIQRKGYLHMINFYNNSYKYQNTELHKYDYYLQIDDESQFTKEVPYNFFDILEDENKLAGAMKVTHAKDKPPHQNNRDTRNGMWEHCKNYIEKYNISPKSQFMQDLLVDPNADNNFHQISFADSYVFKTELFRTKEWKQWNKELNDSGGFYKYRWGDHELNYLFFLIHHDYVVHDFRTVDEGYHNQGGYRQIQNWAPGIKNINL
jgi:hypothetical protein